MSDKLRMSVVRRSNRFRVIMNVPLKLGWKPGTLVDISETGILATHAGVLKTGSTVDISFMHEGQQFAAKAKVESCTVVGLGAGPAARRSTPRASSSPNLCRVARRQIVERRWCGVGDEQSR